jgi:hypothetical protein
MDFVPNEALSGRDKASSERAAPVRKTTINKIDDRRIPGKVDSPAIARSLII